MLCTQVSGVWFAQEGYQHFIHVQLYIAPVPETGFGEDDTAAVGPIYLHVTKFGKKVKILKK